MQGLHVTKPSDDDLLFEVNGTANCSGTQVNQTECPFMRPCESRDSINHHLLAVTCSAAGLCPVLISYAVFQATCSCK